MLLQKIGPQHGTDEAFHNWSSMSLEEISSILRRDLLGDLGAHWSILGVCSDHQGFCDAKKGKIQSMILALYTIW